MTSLPIRSCLRRSRPAVLAAACLALAGCSSFSPDGGMDRVNALVRERAAPPAVVQRDELAAHDAAARAAVLLREPLTADAAAQVANRFEAARAGIPQTLAALKRIAEGTL